ncbi:putative metabolite transport protein CsbC [Janthinobacterium sp. HH103]|uniref:MFS transporter n=1 Tax=unclassified Janthinobacterium TaxID=2610881 RepID=UPI000874E280|nr:MULTISPECIES: MFS transporter [unclassified Janthinobacterium]OEZ52775.1 putative metabolite transport protein CsbC [Janthinobacterium sp. HH100]OEZ52780.1 putative metabolite transport protein CsbC [Janthinobacterium sp. HH100]OEZ69859.1 putative metabolite transport protein CsbC [Janthinobacterium sp. HH103]QOU73445.1 Sugar (and other) transporter [Janthinobacterium sp. HH102]
MHDTSHKGPVWAMRYLLFIAGMGGLLYGIDIGIIAGALPYLESTASVAWKLTAQQLSFIVAAVLLGSVLSSLFAGALADILGRRWVMFLAGALFSASIPLIALADGYTPLLLGRLLQGISGGLIGVVVPLYLAECLPAQQRGRGAALFQLLLTIGLVAAALIGLLQAQTVETATQAAQSLPEAGRIAAIFAAKDHAWRSIFWVCLAPGLVFTIGALLLAESPRWLARRGRVEQARQSLLRTRLPAAADLELREMLDTPENAAKASGNARAKDPLLSRRYVLPFLLACLILACTQATGINSILAYVVNILNQAGLSGASANMADVLLKVLNAVMTVVAVLLVDRKGRKFLLMLGTGGIVVSLLAAGLLFRGAEANLADVRPAIAAQVQNDGLAVHLDAATLTALGAAADGTPQQLTIAYAYGPFTNVKSLRSDDPVLRQVTIAREDAVQADSVIGVFFRKLHLNPFADPAAGREAPLRIEKASLGPVPPSTHGWLVAIAICVFVSSFAVGPGVCVWLALSELMPTRIRSNGMSIALLVNQFVSTVIAAIFLPTVGLHGYSTLFFFGAGCTVLYFLAAAFLLPETKGKTLEEIEAHFSK